MELLAVMSIMALLTTLSVTSYFGAVRSMTRRSAVSHFANTLILARQRACIENSRVSVVVFNDITGADAGADNYFTPSYALCKEVGRISFLNNDLLADEFSEIEKIFGTVSYGPSYKGSIRLYNLTEGKWSNVYPWVEPYVLSQRESASGNPYMTVAERQNGYSLNVFAFRKNARAPSPSEPQWKIGNPYGIEAAPLGTLPRNFEFRRLPSSSSEPVTVTFNPDGSATLKGGGTFTIIEKLPPNKKSTVTVTTTGDVKFDGMWL
jgi:type II secretory pathway pseudopilin PulG